MVNKQILMGNLGKNPEFKETKNGTKFCTFSLATSESWKNKETGERESETEWHNVIAWSGLTSMCKHFKKGDTMYLEGKTKTISWDSEGETKYMKQVVAEKISFTGNKKNNNQTDQNNDFNQEIDDLPF